MQILKSKIDPSVNFVWEIDKGQALEARYVRRHEEYIACYLSTQTACEQACRMCHLTATGQTKPRDASLGELVEQAGTVMKYYFKTQPGARTVHYNFMARGEPLDSLTILNDSQELFLLLGGMAHEVGLVPRFLISTIMPENLVYPLEQYFPTVHPEIYYSLYSMDPKFRKRWLPRAMDPARALDILKDWQYHTKKVIKIHFALIEGVNDTHETAYGIGRELYTRDLRADFALVRYNPPGEKYGKETSKEVEGVFATWLLENSPPGCRVKAVDRVGPDVAASCGMFIQA